MKKFSILMLAVACTLFVSSCQKDPDTGKLDNSYLVYTNYDKGTDFAELRTCHVIDSILIINNQEKPSYWNNSNSATLISEYKKNLEEYGYAIVAADEEPDVVLQLSYVNNTYYFSDYGNPKQLLRMVDIYNKYANAKVISKDNLTQQEKIIVHQYCSHETPKQFRGEVDNDGLMRALIGEIDVKTSPLDYIKFELKYINEPNE